MAALLRALNGGDDSPLPYGGRPKFIKLHPKDDGKGLAPVFFEGELLPQSELYMYWED